jgi:hypothetical protein
MKYPLLVPVIGHGSTDIIERPLQSIILNLASGLLITNMNLINRKYTLIGFSIFHIAQDIPNKFNYVISAFLHYIWLKKPIIAKLNLLLIHTPLHYLRIYYKKDKWKAKIFLGLLTSIIGSIFIEKEFDLLLNKKLGELWWVSPVIAHIILTEIINRNFVNKVNMFNNAVKFKVTNIHHLLK